MAKPDRKAAPRRRAKAREGAKDAPARLRRALLDLVARSGWRDLSYAAIAVARHVWVLAAGAGKAEALRTSLVPEGITPLARVIKSRKATCVFSDIK